jgi:hypothetical protein
MKAVNRIRILRNYLFLLLIITFCGGLISINLFFFNKWFYVLAIVDTCILSVILLVVVEVTIGEKYESLYLEQFLSKIFNKNYLYKRNHNSDALKILMNMKTFNPDCKYHINHYFIIKKENIDYHVFYTKIYSINYRGNKIVHFKGNIVVIPNGGIKDLFPTNLGKHYLYKISGNVLQLSVHNDVVLYQRKRKSFLNKPLFKKIDHHLLENKLLELKNLEKIIDDFYSGFKDEKNLSKWLIKHD